MQEQTIQEFDKEIADFLRKKDINVRIFRIIQDAGQPKIITSFAEQYSDFEVRSQKLAEYILEQVTNLSINSSEVISLQQLEIVFSLVTKAHLFYIGRHDAHDMDLAARGFPSRQERQENAKIHADTTWKYIVQKYPLYALKMTKTS